MKINTVSVLFLCFVKHQNKVYSNDIDIHKTYSEEKLEHDSLVLFITTKFFTILTMKPNQSFFYWNTFPAAEHDNTVLSSNAIIAAEYLLQIF